MRRMDVGTSPSQVSGIAAWGLLESAEIPQSRLRRSHFQEPGFPVKRQRERALKKRAESKVDLAAVLPELAGGRERLAQERQRAAGRVLGDAGGARAAEVGLHPTGIEAVDRDGAAELVGLQADEAVERPLADPVAGDPRLGQRREDPAPEVTCTMRGSRPARRSGISARAIR